MTDGQSAAEGGPSPLPPESKGFPAWVPWAWMFFILVICWFPTDRIRLSESAAHKKVPHLDKMVHFGIFAVYGALGRRSRGKWSRVVATVGVGVLVAVVSEIGQASSLVKRDGSWPDVLADVAGLLTGIAIADRAFRKTGRQYRVSHSVEPPDLVN